MRTYIGMNPIGHKRVLTDPVMKTKPMDLLFSFAYSKEYNLLKDFPLVNLMVDSGAYTLNRKEPDFKKAEQHAKEYMKFMLKTKNDPRIKYYMELDYFTLITYDEIKELNQKLHDITNNVIPVWHKIWGAKKFMKMCQENTYIAIPCALGKELEKNSLIHYVNYAHKHNCKIHGLGLTNVKVLDKVPFDSVDSMSWIQSANFSYYGARRTYIQSEYVSDNVEKVSKGTFLQHLAQAEHYYKKWRWYHND